MAFQETRNYVAGMKAKVLFARHALHPMLVMLPLGLLTTSVVWDVCRLATNRPMWGVIAFWTIVAGVVGALLAAVPGFVDWLAIPAGTRAKTVGLYHMVLNLTVVALFVVSLAARWATPGGYGDAGVGRMIWGWIAVVIAMVSAWLGGELIETLGISVREGANPDAPSSLGEHRGSSRGSRIPARREV
jgi:uncharacterized membrane protein